eukprot:PITA_28546
MACNARIVMKALLSKYRGFDGLTSLVDIEGGTGTALAEIVRAYPSIRGIDYDLPHVMATAPHLPGVEHMGGNMFETAPSVDAIFMKWILHDWGDEDYIKILKSCRKAIPETGKFIIVDMVVLDSNQRCSDNNNIGGQKEKPILDLNLVLVFDLIMVAHCSGGKERTEEEWKKLLVESGFGRFKIITIPDFQSVVEAFPS